MLDQKINIHNEIQHTYAHQYRHTFSKAQAQFYFMHTQIHTCNVYLSIKHSYVSAFFFSSFSKACVLIYVCRCFGGESCAVCQLQVPTGMINCLCRSTHVSAQICRGKLKWPYPVTRLTVHSLQAFSVRFGILQTK